MPSPGASSGGGTVFVTVGTTKFDALIRAVDQQVRGPTTRPRGLGLPRLCCTRCFMACKAPAAVHGTQPCLGACLGACMR